MIHACLYYICMCVYIRLMAYIYICIYMIYIHTWFTPVKNHDGQIYLFIDVNSGVAEAGIKAQKNMDRNMHFIYQC